MTYQTLPRILFFDIETVSGQATFQELSSEMKELWTSKASYWLRDVNTNELTEKAGEAYEEKAGIYAEFGQVICISMGIITLGEDSVPSLRIRSICGGEEKQLLTEFAELLSKYYPDPEKYFLCGHNIREFDVPYLARRMIIQGIALPAMLDIAGKKPWEIKYLLDTMEQWKFGDYKHFTSLRLLAHILGIPSPKDDIDGGDVGRVFWKDQNLERIRHYCEKDVVTTAQVFLRLSGLPQIEEDRLILR